MELYRDRGHCLTIGIVSGIVVVVTASIATPLQSAFLATISNIAMLPMISFGSLSALISWQLRD